MKSAYTKKKNTTKKCFTFLPIDGAMLINGLRLKYFSFDLRICFTYIMSLVMLCMCKKEQFRIKICKLFWK